MTSPVFPIHRAPLPNVSARAFTLIETLITIGIILVLASLSLPAINKFSQSGKQATSISRLRALQQANIQYATENEGAYVPFLESKTVSVNGDTRNNPYWFYNPEFVSLIEANTGAYYYGRPAKSTSSPFVTPALNQAMGNSFGYNIDGLTSIAPYWPPAKRTINNLPSASKLLAFAESQSPQITAGGSTAYAVPEKSTANAIAYRFKGKANAVFFDGHVEQLSKEQVAGNTTLWRGTP